MKIPIIERFKSIQGEGPEMGQPTTFVRVAGCNMQPKCYFCDTNYSWIPNAEIVNMPIKELADSLQQTDHITITGGEPTLYDKQLKELRKLLPKDTWMSVETNGLIQTDVPYNAIVVSPKKQKTNLEVLTNYAGMQQVDFKFVYERKQAKWWEDVIKQTGISQDRVYIMPQGKTVNEQLQLMPEVMRYCSDKGFIFSPRLHILAYNERRRV